MEKVDNDLFPCFFMSSLCRFYVLGLIVIYLVYFVITSNYRVFRLSYQRPITWKTIFFKVINNEFHNLF